MKQDPVKRKNHLEGLTHGYSPSLIDSFSAVLSITNDPVHLFEALNKLYQTALNMPRLCLW